MFKEVGMALDAIAVSLVVCYLCFSFYLCLLRRKQQLKLNENSNVQLNFV